MCLEMSLNQVFLLHKLEQVLKHRMREVYFVLNSGTLPMHENKTDPTLVQQRHLYSKNNRKEIYMGNLEWEQDSLCIAKWSKHTLLIGQQPKYHCSLKWRQHWPWIKRAFFISNQCSRPKTSSFCCNRLFLVRRSSLFSRADNGFMHHVSRGTSMNSTQSLNLIWKVALMLFLKTRRKGGMSRSMHWSWNVEKKGYFFFISTLRYPQKGYVFGWFYVTLYSKLVTWHSLPLKFTLNVALHFQDI